MNEILGFDTETTGLPNWKTPSGGDDQPHIVQLAAMRINEETQEVKQSLDVIIKPDGWVIPEETIEVHGITQEYAMDVGVPEKTALEMFLAMHEGCSKRIAYNTTFDNRIIRIATKRYSTDEVMDAWKAGKYECAMQMARKASPASKPHKLEAAYKIFTGKKLVDAHNALADTQACMEVYFAAKKQLAEAV